MGITILDFGLFTDCDLLKNLKIFNILWN